MSKRSASDDDKKGKRQMTALIDAVSNNTLSETQGANWKRDLLKDGDVVTWLRGKLAAQRSRSDRQLPTFDYLEAHVVSVHGDTSAQAVASLRAQLDAKYGSTCHVSTTHPQLKLPCSSSPVTASDEKNGKRIGLLQVQSYLLQELIESGDVSDKSSLMTALQIRINNESGVAAHLCKRICLAPYHCVHTTFAVNKAHDFCPAWWVVNGNLVNFCTCPTAKKCLRPGPQFQAAEFKAALTRALTGAPEPLLQTTSAAAAAAAPTAVVVTDVAVQVQVVQVANVAP